MLKNRLINFLILTFSITWLAWWSLALLLQAETIKANGPAFMLLFLLGGAGPTIAPFVTCLWLDGKKGLGAYSRAVFKWKLPVYWYILAFAVLLACRVAAVGIYSLLDLQFDMRLQPFLRYFPVLFMMILGGGLEEFGWRGLALPELLKKMNPLSATILLGLIWSLWHLPLFFTPGTSQYQNNFAGFTYHTLAVSFILTWLFLKTKSVFIPLLVHAFSNTLSETIAVSGAAHFDLLDDSIRLAVGLVLVVFFSKNSEMQEFQPSSE